MSVTKLIEQRGVVVPCLADDAGRQKIIAEPHKPSGEIGEMLDDMHLAPGDQRHGARHKLDHLIVDAVLSISRLYDKDFVVVMTMRRKIVRRAKGFSIESPEQERRRQGHRIVVNKIDVCNILGLFHT